MKYNFTSGAELLEKCNELNMTMSQICIEREAELLGITKEEVREKMAVSLQIMKAATEKAVEEDIKSMGGLIGGAAMFMLAYFLVGKFYFKGKQKNIHIKHFSSLLGIAPCCITIAHAFGRIGCLMAGCCHGEYLGSDYVFGGIYMRGTTDGWGYYVPTQLYEALFLFALFAVLSILYFKRYNILLQIYLIAYAVWRMFIEFFRADSRGELIGSAISPSQWQSIIFILIGVALFLIYYFNKTPFRLPLQEDKETLEKTKK